MHVAENNVKTAVRTNGTSIQVLYLKEQAAKISEEGKIFARPVEKNGYVFFGLVKDSGHKISYILETLREKLYCGGDVLMKFSTKDPGYVIRYQNVIVPESYIRANEKASTQERLPSKATVSLKKKNMVDPAIALQRSLAFDGIAVYVNDEKECRHIFKFQKFIVDAIKRNNMTYDSDVVRMQVKQNLLASSSSLVDQIQLVSKILEIRGVHFNNVKDIYFEDDKYPTGRSHPFIFSSQERQVKMFKQLSVFCNLESRDREFIILPYEEVEASNAKSDLNESSPHVAPVVAEKEQETASNAINQIQIEPFKEQVRRVIRDLGLKSGEYQYKKKPHAFNFVGIKKAKMVVVRQNLEEKFPNHKFTWNKKSIGLGEHDETNAEKVVQKKSMPCVSTAKVGKEHSILMHALRNVFDIPTHKKGMKQGTMFMVSNPRDSKIRLCNIADGLINQIKAHFIENFSDTFSFVFTEKLIKYTLLSDGGKTEPQDAITTTVENKPVISNVDAGTKVFEATQLLFASLSDEERQLIMAGYTLQKEISSDQLKADAEALGYDVFNQTTEPNREAVTKLAARLDCILVDKSAISFFEE